MCIWHVTANGEILHHPHVNLLHGSCKHIFVGSCVRPLWNDPYRICYFSAFENKTLICSPCLLSFKANIPTAKWPQCDFVSMAQKCFVYNSTLINVTRIQYTFIFILTGYKIKCKPLVLFTWCLWKLLLYKKVNNLSLDIHVNA